VKVIDRVEHPALRADKPVTVFPSSLGGLNYSPASYDPTTNYVFNGAAETAVVMVQSKLTPTQKKNKFVLGDVFLGLQNGDFGTVLPGWHDHAVDRRRFLAAASVRARRLDEGVAAAATRPPRGRRTVDAGRCHRHAARRRSEACARGRRRRAHLDSGTVRRRRLERRPSER